MKEPFTKLERNAWGGFVRVQGVMFRWIEEDLRRYSGLTHAEFEVLLRLWRRSDKRARIQDLADASLLTRSGTSRLVTRLQQAGFVAREEAAEDGRGAYAILTPSGDARFQEAADRHIALVRREFLERFSEEELSMMAAFWARIEGSAGPLSETS